MSTSLGQDRAMRTEKLIRSRRMEANLSEEDRQRIEQRRVYKFYHSSAETPVLGSGSILVGTAGKYWAIDNIALRDTLDGQTATRVDDFTFEHGMPVDHLVDPTSPFHGFARTFIGSVAHGDIQFSGFDFVSKHDFYMYSFSYECTQSVVKSFASDPFDWVAEISDIYGLAETLAQIHPQLIGLYYCILPMTYRDIYRTPGETHPDPLQSMFEKDSSFASNKEGRIVFFEFEPPGRIGYSLVQLPIPKPFASLEIRKWFSRGHMPTA